MRNRIGLFIFIFCCTLLSVAGCGRTAIQEDSKSAVTSENTVNATGVANVSAEKVVKIGLIAPLSGEFSVYGRQMRNAFNLAVEEKNREAGSLKVEFVIADDRGEDGEAGAAAASLITQEKVNAVVGSLTYNCNILISDFAQNSKVPMITPASPLPRVTYHMGARKDYIYCTAFGDYFHGAAAAGFALENLYAKTAAVLYAGDDEISISMAEQFMDRFETGGGKITFFESYSRAGGDFSGKLAAMAGQNPDIMYFPDAYDWAGRISSLAHGTAVIYSGVVWDSDSIDRQAMEGAYCTEQFSADNPRPEAKEFISRYYNKYNSVPGETAALTYEATKILLQAVEMAGTSEPAKIKEAIQDMKEFQALTGKFTFDQGGSPVKPAVIIQVRDGKHVYVADAAPRY